MLIRAENCVEEGKIVSEQQELVLLANGSDESLVAGAVQSMFWEPTYSSTVHRVSKIEAKNRPAKQWREEESKNIVSATC